MPQFDRQNLPPLYPKPDASAPARRRYGKAMYEYRRLQGSPLTYGKFNLYTWYGRLYLGLIFATAIGMAAACIRMMLERPPRLWDEWIITFVAPLGPLVVPTIMVIMYRSHRRIYRLANNLCPKCAYDLRESPDRCPECGLSN
jgi:hypothetical protein